MWETGNMSDSRGSLGALSRLNERGDAPELASDKRWPGRGQNWESGPLSG